MTAGHIAGGGARNDDLVSGRAGLVVGAHSVVQVSIVLSQSVVYRSEVAVGACDSNWSAVLHTVRVVHVTSDLKHY